MTILFPDLVLKWSLTAAKPIWEQRKWTRTMFFLFLSLLGEGALRKEKKSCSFVFSNLDHLIICLATSTAYSNPGRKDGSLQCELMRTLFGGFQVGLCSSQPLFCQFSQGKFLRFFFNVRAFQTPAINKKQTIAIGDTRKVN